MATSYTGTIKTNGEFIDISTESGVTFTSGKSYTIQILPNNDIVYFKVADAIFEIDNSNPFTYTAGSDSPKLKTNYKECTLTILEGA